MSERKQRSDKGKKRIDYVQDIRAYHAQQRRLKDTQKLLQDLRDEESDEENERKLAELLRKPRKTVEDIPSINEENAKKLEESQERSKVKRELKEGVEGFEYLSYNEKRKEYRKALRLSKLPVNRICPKCNKIKSKSKQWRLINDKCLICRSCLLKIEQFCDEINLDFELFLEYVVSNDIKLEHDCLGVADCNGCNCARCSAILLKEQLNVDDDNDNGSAD